MAQIKNMSWDMEENRAVTVGHNRTVTRYGNKFECRLHGHCIVTLELTSPCTMDVTLDDCGHRTVTTRQAMQDFIRAMNGSIGVSFANGGFGVRWLDDDACWRDCSHYYGWILSLRH